MTSPDSNICEFLPWDSAFFGLHIARAHDHRLTADLAQEMLAWCSREEIDCVYFLADADDPTTVVLAEEYHFQLVDIRVTLTLDGKQAQPHPGPAPHVRIAAAEDIKALQAIARESHLDSRFFYDSHFPRERCAALYALWIEKSCTGYADAVLVFDDGGGAAGYITCHLDTKTSGRIGLVGVAQDQQGKGAGSALVSTGVDWLMQAGATTLSVVTQGRNVRAQRLYQRKGFVTESVQLWYHRWLTDVTI
ncbi:MAG: GNAT family N-acetyltransferase [Anaerolineae bacterium]|nr:GNAT family N-acetyltransferase [Anaerolineae bacterium]